MKKIFISIVFLILISSTLVVSTPIIEEKNNDNSILDDPKPIDKFVVIFREAGGNVVWDKLTQDLLELPPFPFFVYFSLYEGGWIKTLSGKIYEFPEVKTVICKFFIGDRPIANEPLQDLKAIAFGLELL